MYTMKPYKALKYRNDSPRCNIESDSRTCMGTAFAGPMARSQARCWRRASNLAGPDSDLATVLLLDFLEMAKEDEEGGA